MGCLVALYTAQHSPHNTELSDPVTLKLGTPAVEMSREKEALRWKRPLCKILSAYDN